MACWGLAVLVLTAQETRMDGGLDPTLLLTSKVLGIAWGFLESS